MATKTSNNKTDVFDQMVVEYKAAQERERVKNLKALRKPNPLDKYRSYAYHHVLVVANSTEAIRPLANPGVTLDQDLAFYKDLKLGEPAGQENAPYFLVCDTRKTSYFSITDVSFSSSVSGTGKHDYTGLILGKLTMKMVDSTGVGLINYLKHVSTEKLGISLHNATFFLKTLFVGHTDTGTTEIVTQTGIPMSIHDISMVPNHLGSTLDIIFNPLPNGIAVQDANYAKIADIPGVYSQTNKLKDAIKSLENAMNKKSREWYKELQIRKLNNEVMNGGNGTASKKSNDQSLGKLVQYMFTIPTAWDSFEIKGVYQNATESKYKKDGSRETTNVKGVYVGFNSTPETTIEQLINLILRQSNDVQKLANNEKREKGKIEAFEIHTQITSDNDSVTVHYDILGLAVPKPVANEERIRETADLFKITEENIAVYDYIFTGKNTDILNFELKLNKVNVAIADDLFIGAKSQEESSKDQKDKDGDKTNTAKKQALMNFLKKDPVVLPAKTGSQMANMPWLFSSDSNSDAVKNRQQFINNLALCAAQSTINAILKIRGNPDLFRRFIDEDVFTHVKIPDSIATKYVSSSDEFVNGVGANKTYLSENDIATYKIERALSVKRKYGGEYALPFFVKINIMGPDYDFSKGSVTEVLDSGPKYTQMWFKGWFMVKKINHYFSNGEFYQEMLLGSSPADAYGEDGEIAIKS